MKFFQVLKRDGESVELDASIDELKAAVDAHTPMIVRNLFSAEEVALVRQLSVDFHRSSEPSNPPIEAGAPNFHRIDVNHPKSRVKSIVHTHIYFYWNQESAPIAHLFRRAFRLRNLLSGLPADYALNDVRDDFVSVPTVIQYPRGGGYMQEHKDPDVGQKVVISIAMSEFGEDFSSGGLFWRSPEGEKIMIDPLMKPGDALMFYPMDPHGIDPVDSDIALDWSRADGRWMMMSALVTLNSLHGRPDPLMAEGIGKIYEAAI